MANSQLDELLRQAHELEHKQLETDQLPPPDVVPDIQTITPQKTHAKTNPSRFRVFWMRLLIAIGMCAMLLSVLCVVAFGSNHSSSNELSNPGVPVDVLLPENSGFSGTPDEEEMSETAPPGWTENDSVSTNGELSSQGHLLENGADDSSHLLTTGESTTVLTTNRTSLTTASTTIQTFTKATAKTTGKTTSKPTTQPSKTNPTTAQTTTKAASSGSASDTLRVVFGGKTQQMEAARAVAIWVSNEIPTSYPVEAIKAQAVASYTYIKYYNQAGSAVNIGSTDAKITSAVTKAVNAVAGKAMYSGGKLAFTPWHAMSIGVTLPSEQVWSSATACLKAVDSSIEIGTKTDSWSPYAVTKTFSKAQMQKKLENYIATKKLNITLSANPANWLKVQSYYSTVSYAGKKIGYVKACSLDGKATFTGPVFRNQVMSGAGLRSSAFDISYDSAQQIFSVTTYGYGHGCGMSQTGMKLYAQQGWSYTKILTHYYTGVDIR